MVTATLEDADLRRRAWDAAAQVVDPEIPVLTIADLGVLRDVAVGGREVRIEAAPGGVDVAPLDAETEGRPEVWDQSRHHVELTDREL